MITLAMRDDVTIHLRSLLRGTKTTDRDLEWLGLDFCYVVQGPLTGTQIG